MCEVNRGGECVLGFGVEKTAQRGVETIHMPFTICNLPHDATSIITSECDFLVLTGPKVGAPFEVAVTPDRPR